MAPWLLANPPVPTYGLCLLAAIVAGWLLARRCARARGVDPSHVDFLVPLLVAAGIVGAWAFGLWTRAMTGSEGGLVLAGALLLPLLAGIAYARLAMLPLGETGDLFAAPVALTIAIGRVGCLFAGCCFGKVCATSFPAAAGIHFPPASVAFGELVRLGLLDPHAHQTPPLVPVQALEAAGCLVLMMLVRIVASRVRRGRGVAGEAFLTLGLGYALLRFALEFARADNPPAWGWLTFSQGIMIGVFAAAVLTAWVRRHWKGPLGLARPGKQPAPPGDGGEGREGCGPQDGRAPLVNPGA